MRKATSPRFKKISERRELGMKKIKEIKKNGWKELKKVKKNKRGRKPSSLVTAKNNFLIMGTKYFKKFNTKYVRVFVRNNDLLLIPSTKKLVTIIREKNVHRIKVNIKNLLKLKERKYNASWNDKLGALTIYGVIINEEKKS